MGINQDFKNNLAWNKQEKISENASSNLSEILCFSLFILESIGAIMQNQLYAPCHPWRDGLHLLQSQSEHSK